MYSLCLLGGAVARVVEQRAHVILGDDVGRRVRDCDDQVGDEEAAGGPIEYDDLREATDLLAQRAERPVGWSVYILYVYSGRFWTERSVEQSQSSVDGPRGL